MNINYLLIFYHIILCDLLSSILLHFNLQISLFILGFTIYLFSVFFIKFCSFQYFFVLVKKFNLSIVQNSKSLEPIILNCFSSF